MFPVMALSFTDECFATKAKSIKKVGYKAKGRGTFLVSKRSHVKVGLHFALLGTFLSIVNVK